MQTLVNASILVSNFDFRIQIQFQNSKFQFQMQILKFRTTYFKVHSI
jgi:hypothetical protein